MFESLAVEIKELATLDPAALDDVELSGAAVELARLRCVFEAAEARLVHEWDTRRVWADSGARSGAAWLARETRAPKPDCGARLRLGRAARHLPVAADAWAAGDIGAAHLRVLAGARNARTADALARDEALLVGHARTLTLTFAEFHTVSTTGCWPRPDWVASPRSASWPALATSAGPTPSSRWPAARRPCPPTPRPPSRCSPSSSAPTPSATSPSWPAARSCHPQRSCRGPATPTSNASSSTAAPPGSST